MPKLSGQWLQILLDDSGGSPRDVSNDVNSIDIPIEHSELDYTGFLHSIENMGAGMPSLNIELAGDFNDAATTGLHTVLSSIVGKNTPGFTLTVRVGDGAAPQAGDPEIELEVICPKYGVSATPKGKTGVVASLRPFDPDSVPAWGVMT